MYKGFFRLGAIRILIDNAYALDAKIHYVQKYKRENRREGIGTVEIHLCRQAKRISHGLDSPFHHRQYRFPKMAVHDDVRSLVLVIAGDTGRTSGLTRGATVGVQS